MLPRCRRYSQPPATSYAAAGLCRPVRRSTLAPDTSSRHRKPCEPRFFRASQLGSRGEDRCAFAPVKKPLFERSLAAIRNTRQHAECGEHGFGKNFGLLSAVCGAAHCPNRCQGLFVLAHADELTIQETGGKFARRSNPGPDHVGGRCPVAKSWAGSGDLRHGCRRLARDRQISPPCALDLLRDQTRRHFMRWRESYPPTSSTMSANANPDARHLTAR